jgi:hypothetical protein
VPDVISNTSPIQYLFQIGLLDLLFSLYEEVTVPEAVNSELVEGRSHGVDLPDADVLSQFNVRTVRVEKNSVAYIAGDRRTGSAGFGSCQPRLSGTRGLVMKLAPESSSTAL